MILPGKLDDVIASANVGHYTDREIDTGVPFLVWKMHTDLIEFIVRGGDFHLYAYEVSSGENCYLVLVTCIEDDPTQPYMVQTPLYATDRAIWRQVLLNGRATIYLYDNASRPLSICEATFVTSEENAFRAALFRDGYIDPVGVDEHVRILNLALDNIASVEKSLPRYQMEMRPKQGFENLVVISTAEIGISGTEDNLLALAPRRLGLPNDGELLENDIADALNKLFPAEMIFVNPHKANDKKREYCDVLVVGVDHILMIQAKKKKHRAVNSEYDSEINLSRNEKMARAGGGQLIGSYEVLATDLKYDIAIAKGDIHRTQAVYLKAMAEAETLPYEIFDSHITVNLGGRRIVPLVIMSELHPKSFKNLSNDFVAWSNQLGCPVLVWPYDTLVDLIRACADEMAFFESIQAFGLRCVREGRLMNARFIRPDDDADQF